jgi:hypothetical protein
MKRSEKEMTIDDFGFWILDFGWEEEEFRGRALPPGAQSKR